MKRNFETEEEVENDPIICCPTDTFTFRLVLPLSKAMEVAQRLARMPPYLEVLGSIPAATKNYFRTLCSLFPLSTPIKIVERKH